MTIKRLEQYRSIKRQIDDYEKNNDISYINGVDTTKPAVQSNKISDTTANNAIKKCQQISKKEYAELCNEFNMLNNYIFGIEDVITREIAKLKFINGNSFEVIAEKMNYSRAGVYKRLKNYIKNHKEQTKYIEVNK